MKADIQSDAARMEKELADQNARDQRDRDVIGIAMDMKGRQTFNVLTGEGVGRECEYRPLGKRIVNPYGCMEAVFSEHARDSSNRAMQSRHRFYDIPESSDQRCLALHKEGLTETHRNFSILGPPVAGMPTRTRAASCGVGDNFAHLRQDHLRGSSSMINTGRSSVSGWEAPPDYNRSQIFNLG